MLVLGRFENNWAEVQYAKNGKKYTGWINQNYIVSNYLTLTLRKSNVPAYCAPSRETKIVGSLPKYTQLIVIGMWDDFYIVSLRNASAWEEYWRWDSDDTTVAVYYSKQGKPLGYMVYLIKEDVMYIKEMIYLNREAQKGLWDYISAHYSMIDEVRGNTYQNELLAFYLEDGNITETIKPYIMGRIVDVEAFFMRYRCDPTEEDVCFRFEIEDDFLDWNNRGFNVYFHDGKATVTDREPRYTVRMSIGTLSTLLLGYMTAIQLFRLERIEGTPEAVQILDEVVIHQIPYISDFI